MKQKEVTKRMITNHLSKKDLQKHLGCTGAAMYGWFRGEPISPKFTEAVCHVFDCKFEDVFEIVEN